MQYLQWGKAPNVLGLVVSPSWVFSRRRIWELQVSRGRQRVGWVRSSIALFSHWFSFAPSDMHPMSILFVNQNLHSESTLLLTRYCHQPTRKCQVRPKTQFGCMRFSRDQYNLCSWKSSSCIPVLRTIQDSSDSLTVWQEIWCLTSFPRCENLFQF